jgi:pSer/pThr/pTyr-binding forkhead associated (FHA) protein
VQAGGPTRHNDIAFSEEDSVSKSVSRQHAHIERDAKTGQYRLFNDRVYKGAENCGVYLVRGGVSHAVHRGGHGSALQDGDEIHLAQAILRFGI